MRSALFRLLRPANVVTSLADVLAGAALAGGTDLGALAWLLGATTCLYGGGIVLNDVFDRRLDAIERPERPIPSGRVSVAVAGTLGATLLLAGVGLALAANRTAGLVAAAVAGAVLLYDTAGKRHPVFGPINMGLCRGLNLMLGMAILPAALSTTWPFGGLALAYIAGVTVLSRGEVAGGRQPMAFVSLALIAGVILVLLRLAIGALPAGFGLVATLIVALLAWRVLPPFLAAARSPAPATIRNAVRHGVLSLVLLNAALAAQAGALGYTAAILVTGLLAGRLARVFAVT